MNRERRLKHPDGDGWITRKMASDLGILDAAEEATERFEADRREQAEQERAEHALKAPEPLPAERVPEDSLGWDIERELADDGGWAPPEERADPLPSDPDVWDVWDEEDWFDGAGPSLSASGSPPLYTNRTPSRLSAEDEDATPSTPAIDRRARDWEDRGQRYEARRDGGVRVVRD